MIDLLSAPWPWYVTGVVIGLSVPVLLLIGNKRLGVSSTLRHICAACIPSSGIALFRYNWRNEIWSLFLIAGILIGGFIANYVLVADDPANISETTTSYLEGKNVAVREGALLPENIFNWNSLFTLKGFLMIVVGGFLVGFGTRYAQGCTSGHGIFGLSTLQWPSLVAIASFFAGGILFTHLVLPYILQL